MFNKFGKSTLAKLSNVHVKERSLGMEKGFSKIKILIFVTLTSRGLCSSFAFGVRVEDEAKTEAQRIRLRHYRPVKRTVAFRAECAYVPTRALVQSPTRASRRSIRLIAVSARLSLKSNHFPNRGIT